LLYLSNPDKVYLYCKVVDFRKQLNGLSILIATEFPEGSIEKNWFVFVSRDKKKVKLVYWRGAGLVLWQYHLEKDLFKLGRPRRSITSEVTLETLDKFLAGLNIFDSSHKLQTPKRYS